MSGEITIVETSSINIDVTSGDAQITIVADNNNISVVKKNQYLLALLMLENKECQVLKESLVQLVHLYNLMS